MSYFNQSALDYVLFQFIVPDGFVVTVNAFNRQLDLNFNMKKSVAILDDIFCGRCNGNLEQACAE